MFKSIKNAKLSKVPTQAIGSKLLVGAVKCKKIIISILMIVLVVALVGCGTTNGGGDNGTREESPLPQEPTYDSDTIYLHINDSTIAVALENNTSVQSLLNILQEGDIIYSASDYGGFEKVGYIGHVLQTNHTNMTAQPLDVILYGNSNIVIFYGSNNWSYTKLGKIQGHTVQQLRSVMGSGNVTIRISLE